MVSHLPKLTHLEDLQVYNMVNGMDEDSVKGLCEIISSQPHLTTLRLPFNDFTSESIEMLCESISKLDGLTHLDLSRSAFDEASMNALGKVVSNLPILYLELYDITWKSSGFEAFVAQLDDWCYLKSLNLSHYETISEENTTELGSELSKLTSLILLDIRCCEPDDYFILLEPLKSLPLQVLFLNAPPDCEDTETSLPLQVRCVS